MGYGCICLPMLMIFDFRFYAFSFAGNEPAALLYRISVFPGAVV